MIEPILAQRRAAGFWLAVLLTGTGTGLAAAALTGLLELVQHLMWGGDGLDLLQAASSAGPWRHIAALLGAGLLTGAGQLLLTRLSSGNGIDITAAIWFHAGRLPALRTLGSAILSIVIVGMGTALGREGAPKQAGAVIANAMSDRVRLSADERRLLVACGAGAGMAAAYGVPLGGALFALEVLRGALALRFVLPAVVTTLVATEVSWAFLPDVPLYVIPAYHGSLSSIAWALLAGPIAGLASVLYVRSVAWADRHKPTGWRRVWAPVVALGVLGAVSIPLPQLLGNGRDMAELAFTGGIGPLLLLALVLLRPAATILCLGSGAPGGLFTPSLAVGAMHWAACSACPGRGSGPACPQDYSRCWVPRDARRHDAGPDFDGRADDGDDRIRARGDRTNAARGGDRDAGRTHDRAAIDLRRAPQRRAGPRTGARPRSRTGGAAACLMPGRDDGVRRSLAGINTDPANHPGNRIRHAAGPVPPRR
jgi:CIC family chloride channel protein